MSAFSAATSPWGHWCEVVVNPFLPRGVFVMDGGMGRPVVAVRHRQVLVLLVAEMNKRERLPRKLKKAIKKMRAEEWP